MFNNYLIIAYRQILKNKLFSFINIGGLAIGLAACILIGLFVQYEYSHDQFWQDKERIYQVNTSFNYPGFSFVNEGAAAPVKAELKQYFSQFIEYSARFNSVHPVIKVADNLFEQQVYTVDAELLKILNFDVIQGDLTLALADLNSIAISESVADKFFTSKDVLGKTIQYQNHDDVRPLKVAAVYRDIAANSVYDFPALLLLNDRTTVAEGENPWNSSNYGTLVKITDPQVINELTRQLPDFIEAKATLDDYWQEQGAVKTEMLELAMVAVDQIYLSSDDNLETIYLYQIIAVLILVVACFNFMNLSLAQSTKRLKEVGLRKSLGATQQQIGWQFIIETYALAIAALFLAVVIVEISLPWYQLLWDRPLTLDYTSITNFAAIIGLLSIVAIIGGGYPALVSARYKPANVLTANQSSSSVISSGFRNLLVIAQFTASISMIICAAVIYSQVSYSMDVERGYDKDKLVILHGVGREPVSQRQDTLKQELLKLPGVESASYIDLFPATLARGVTTFSLKEGSAEDTISLGYRPWDHDFAQTFDQKLLAGRFFSKEHAEDQNSADNKDAITNIIINEQAISRLGFDSASQAINQIFETKEKNFRIVGVVANTKYRSLKSEVEPEMYQLRSFPGGFLVVKFKDKPKLQEAALEDFWHKHVSELPLVTTYVEDLANAEFEQEKTSASLLFSSAILAVVIACFGLFGLAKFTSQKRTKEIGIRKVYGASRIELVSLLVWQFSKPVLISCIIGLALAATIMFDWLEQYPYRIDHTIVWFIGMTTCLLAFVLATLTIMGNTLKVTRDKPIKALRYE